MFVDYFRFGIKNLKRRKVRSWLTLLGIFIGIAAVVSLITLGQGLKSAVVSQFGMSSMEVITVQAGGLTYGPPGSGIVNPLTEDDVAAIKRIDNVETATGRIIESIKLEFNNHLEIATAFTVGDGEEREFDYESNEFEAWQGRLLQDGDINKIMIGRDMSDKEKNGFGREIAPGNEVLINNKEFRVVGVLEKKGSFIYDSSIIMNRNVLNELAGNGEEVDIILVKVDDKDSVEGVKKDIERLLRQRRNVNEGEEDFEVQTPEAMLETVNQILGGIQTFVVLIAAVSIVVGGIGIVNTMTTSVVERRKEIGIMKAIGAKNSDIFLQFFIEAGLLGLIGGAIGIIIGINIGIFGIMAINNFIGAATAPQINLWLIFGALAGSFLIGSLSGIAPAMKAAKQNPVQALRG